MRELLIGVGMFVVGVAAREVDVRSRTHLGFWTIVGSATLGLLTVCLR